MRFETCHSFKSSTRNLLEQIELFAKTAERDYDNEGGWLFLVELHRFFCINKCTHSHSIGCINWLFICIHKQVMCADFLFFFYSVFLQMACEFLKLFAYIPPQLSNQNAKCVAYSAHRSFIIKVLLCEFCCCCSMYDDGR